MQQALFEQRTPIYNAETLLTNLNALTTRFQQAGSLYIFVQHDNNKMLRKGTPGWRFHPGLYIDKRATTIAKTHGNAFQDTNLHALLQENGISTVVISGLVTRGCVRATCIGGHKLDYHVVLVGDAHSSYHKQAQQRIADWNEEFDTAYGDLCTSASISLG